jgi:Lrp/AsnC family transcriptional regulator, leucine-responsive regulatory protein
VVDGDADDDQPDAEQVLDRFLRDGQTTTSIVVSTPVPPRPLPLTAPATS